MNIVWSHDAWTEFTWWQERDRRIVKRIVLLIRDIQRGDDQGVGKPELLRGELSGYASRRINEEHRFVYRVREDNLEIISCRSHY